MSCLLESKCPIIPRLSKVIGVQDPEFDCFNKTLKVGDKCTFWCPGGYSLKGRAVFECLPGSSAIGNWNVNTGITSNIPTCIGELF